MKGILHRDISINNILITPHANHARGLIIDLDMAIWIHRIESLAGADFRMVSNLWLGFMLSS